MKINDILSKVVTQAHRAAFTARKHSPEILLVTGIVAGVTGAVVACKATTKLDDVVTKAKEEVDDIHKRGAEENSEVNEPKELVSVYARTGVDIAKLYAPAVSLGVASIACVLASHHILKERHAALAAAYVAVDTSFKEYRNRVTNRFGSEVEHEIRYDISTKEIQKEVVNEETGEVTTVTETVRVGNPHLLSEYAKWFDCTSKCWEKNPEYNMMFLRAQQTTANDMLHREGHLFLNEVYDLLGIPRTRAGQVVGWLYNPNDKNCDSFVDFGLYEINRPTTKDFVNGYEPDVVLDFNVQGNILGEFEKLNDMKLRPAY